MELCNEKANTCEEQDKGLTLNVTEIDDYVAAPEKMASIGKTKADLVRELEAIKDKPINEIRDEETLIRATYMAIRKKETEAQKAAFINEGNDEANFVVNQQEEDIIIKDLLNGIKERRGEYNAQQEAQREKNLQEKQEIIAQLQQIVADVDTVNKQYAQVQQLQQRFKEIGEVPPQYDKSLWKSFQKEIELYYDLLKVNKELRDYDFKKNLEIKEKLCVEAERLSELTDIISAYKSMQVLRDTWRSTGPVAKELRNSIWERFKVATTTISKNYQSYFESKKQEEQQNEIAKLALCSEIENLAIDSFSQYSEWENATKKIIELQERWRGLGFASKSQNTSLFARFRKSCDDFFEKKAKFYKAKKDEQTLNLEKKIALCEKAESLKESTDWKKTTESFVAMQQEWKKIGPVAKKHSESIWKRFVAACDYFFEQKAKLNVNIHQLEYANLKAKKAIISEIRELVESAGDESAKKIRELMKKWQEVGHVPFKDKDKVYASYKEVVDLAFEKIDLREKKANLANFENSITQLSNSDKLYRERERLVRNFDQKSTELKTFENNLGFFNAHSKDGNSMLKEMERRILKLKEELNLLETKIKMIDEKL